jgi:putative transposon-encoded protein
MRDFLELTKTERHVLFNFNLEKMNSRCTTKKAFPTGEGLRKVKFEIYGEEMLEKEVKLSGNSGRVYLPPDWVGRYVKIIRTD